MRRILTAANRCRLARIKFCSFALWWTLALGLPALAGEHGNLRQEAAEPRFIDLSLLVAEDYPCTWPDHWPLFQMKHYIKIGPASPYNSDFLLIDGNTGTQLDFPPHSIPLPDSGLPNAGPFGRSFSDKIEAWQFCGEACVIDVRSLCDSAPIGRSDLVTRQHVMAFEKKVRPVGFGDVVLFHSGFSDKYYKPFPAGRRFLADPVEGKTPAWPDPNPDCMEYLGSRKVLTLGCDSPSMGPLPDLAEPTHIAGLKYGMIWTEGATNLGALPPTGAFYCCMGPKHQNGPYIEARAFAIVGNPLARQLIESARKKRVVDLTVPLAYELPVSWPGAGIGNHRTPYMTVLFNFTPRLGLSHQTHVMDSHSGTHLVPPAYALPPQGFNNRDYSPRVQEWLMEYEGKFGPRGTSKATTETIPLDQTAGRARIIPVGQLVGTTSKDRWPDSPVISVADVQKYEHDHGELRPGDVVLFASGHSDRLFKPVPEGKACFEDPLNSKSEGWPAPGPETIVYLAGRGIRCVGTDGPTLGGANPKRALHTYWALGSKGMVGIEYLTGLGKAPDKGYFLFAAIKLRGCHGGPGRAILLY